MRGKTFKIYMDACCFCRPFDNLSQERIFQEALAIHSIIKRSFEAGWTIFASEILEIELFGPVYPSKPNVLKMYNSITDKYVGLTASVEERGNTLQENGMDVYDSLHVALAENCGADIFLTTDDHLLALSKRLDVKLHTANPAAWLFEVKQHERQNTI